MSPYLDKPLRTPRQAMLDAIKNAPELYFLIQRDRAELIGTEYAVIVSRRQLVRDLADGQFDDMVCILSGTVGEKLIDVTDDMLEAAEALRREEAA